MAQHPMNGRSHHARALAKTKEKRAKAEESQLRTEALEQKYCPQKHRLPNKTPTGECTPLYCAVKSKERQKYGDEDEYDREEKALTALYAARKSKARRAQIEIEKEVKEQMPAAVRKEVRQRDALLDTTLDSTRVEDAESMQGAAYKQKQEEVLRLSRGLGRYAAARAFFKAPEGLTGADAENWIAQRALELSVDALLEFERQLKLGDDNQRREAARDILKMAGLDKKEAPVGNNAVIVLNSAGGVQALPWIQGQLQGPAPAALSEVGATARAVHTVVDAVASSQEEVKARKRTSLESMARELELEKDDA